MFIRILGIIVGALFVFVPFLAGPQNLWNVKIWLAPVLGVLFLVYGFGGQQLLTKIVTLFGSTTEKGKAASPMDKAEGNIGDYVDQLAKTVPRSTIVLIVVILCLGIPAAFLIQSEQYSWLGYILYGLILMVVLVNFKAMR